MIHAAWRKRTCAYPLPRGIGRRLLWIGVAFLEGGATVTAQAEIKGVVDISRANPLNGGDFTGFGSGDYLPALEAGLVVFFGGNASHPGSFFSTPSSGGAILSQVTYGQPVPNEPSLPPPTFVTLGGCSLDGGAIAFVGAGWENGASGTRLMGGVYKKTLEGGFSTAANSQTLIPDYGGSFVTSSYASPSADAGQITFSAISSNGAKAGIYLTTPAGLRVVANGFTTIPGTASPFPGGFATNPCLDDGEVVFAAQTRAFGPIDGIFKTTGNAAGQLQTVVDSATTVPDSPEKFSTVALPVMSSGHVSFWGRTDSFKSGIYTTVGGPIRVVADQTTAIPGGSGNFIAFDNNYSLCMHDDRVVFLGFGENSQEGIYLWEAGTLRKLVDANDDIEGRGVRHPEFGREAFDGSGFVFSATFDGPFFQGIYTMPVDADVAPLSAIVLKIELAPPNAVRLTWPGTVVGAHLESSTTLLPASWSTVAAPVTSVNGENVVVDPRGPAGFYRLAPP